MTDEDLEQNENESQTQGFGNEDTRKLNQLKLSSKEKLDTLTKLDEQILCEPDEEHV